MEREGLDGTGFRDERLCPFAGSIGQRSLCRGFIHEGGWKGVRIRCPCLRAISSRSEERRVGKECRSLCDWSSDVCSSDLGYFTTAGVNAASFVAKWNGKDWTALGSGMNDYVHSLAVSGSDLYAGGLFTRAAGKVCGYVARAYVPFLPDRKSVV